jgi:uncharacterized protein
MAGSVPDGLARRHNLPAGADQDVSDWGGAYDKTSVDKVARVVVTVDYGID